MRRLYSDSSSGRIIRDTGENKDEDTREEDKERKAKKKMLESRPEDALVKLVKLVNIVKLVKQWRLY